MVLIKNLKTKIYKGRRPAKFFIGTMEMLRIDHIALLFAVGIQFLFISASKYLLLKIKSGKYVVLINFYKNYHF